LEFGADVAHTFVDDVPQLPRVGIGIALPHILQRAMKQAPADCLLDEFRKAALIGPLGAQRSAHLPLITQ